MVSKSVSAQKLERKKYKQSKNARYDNKINRIKHKCRSGMNNVSVLNFFFAKVLLKIFIFLELDLFSWQKWKFHNNDYWIDSFVDTLKRVDYRFTSKSEFIKKYESKNIPVMITHVTDNWKANKHWTEEVFF
jgi:histone arginine demethylase JMJD6